MTAFPRCRNCGGNVFPMNYVGDVVGALCHCASRSLPSYSMADVYNTQTAAIERLQAERDRLRAEVDALKKNLDYLNADRENLRMFVSKGMHDGALDALQIVKLRAEVERMSRMPITDEQFAALNALRVAGEAQNKAIDMLKAEIESQRADAGRYRWFRDNQAHYSLPFCTENGRWVVQAFPATGGIHERNYKTLDAAIDAARAAQGEQK